MCPQKIRGHFEKTSSFNESMLPGGEVVGVGVVVVVIRAVVVVVPKIINNEDKIL